MKPLIRSNIVASLLAFNGGFVDTAGFLGLNGLFVAHVTGNFVTLGHALVNGSHGIMGKILALPEFIAVIALARLAGIALRARKLPDRRILLTVKVLFLAAFFGLAVGFGPFPDSGSPAALLTGFAGIAAMAMQNAVQRVHMSSMPPSTMMTGSTVQATIDAVDLLTGTTPELIAPVRFRFSRLALTISSFAAGCAASAVLYVHVGFWGLALAVVVGTVAAIVPVEDARPA